MTSRLQVGACMILQTRSVWMMSARALHYGSLNPPRTASARVPDLALCQALQHLCRKPRLDSEGLGSQGLNMPEQLSIFFPSHSERKHVSSLYTCILTGHVFVEMYCGTTDDRMVG